jgi:hypothetical protein
MDSSWRLLALHRESKGGGAGLGLPIPSPTNFAVNGCKLMRAGRENVASSTKRYCAPGPGSSAASLRNQTVDLIL